MEPTRDHVAISEGAVQALKMGCIKELSKRGENSGLISHLGKHRPPMTIRRQTVEKGGQGWGGGNTVQEDFLQLIKIPQVFKRVSF